MSDGRLDFDGQFLITDEYFRMTSSGTSAPLVPFLRRLESISEDKTFSASETWEDGTSMQVRWIRDVRPRCLWVFARAAALRCDYRGNLCQCNTTPVRPVCLCGQMSPTEVFLECLEIPEDDDSPVDLRQAAVVITSHLDRLAAPHLPSPPTGKVCTALDS